VLTIVTNWTVLSQAQADNIITHRRGHTTVMLYHAMLHPPHHMRFLTVFDQSITILVGGLYYMSKNIFGGNFHLDTMSILIA